MNRKSKERLKEYLEVDTLYQDYKKGKKLSHNDGCYDFDLFCVQHCLDIEKLLNEVAVKEEMLKIKDEAFEKLLEENKELHNKIDKAIECMENWNDNWYSYCQQEDKENLIELLEILKGDVDE